MCGTRRTWRTVRGQSAGCSRAARGPSEAMGHHPLDLYLDMSGSDWWFGTWLLFSIYWEFHDPN